MRGAGLFLLLLLFGLAVEDAPDAGHLVAGSGRDEQDLADLRIVLPRERQMAVGFVSPGKMQSMATG